ncbi:DUF4087 domain-containing protein [Roseisalinus antarcticus]|uniref:DUF4087 domain-containing protein n=1 Tax=Roseisalinus antarcticus TaxID=254357 RepID=A0A1Y5TWZ1_9RHOB|nr:DUF4087 domain-containing protein [Roseisalinus antarcticus]SLN75745.1 hypothetical protein ROA7023_04029 [Roseisalinus antarcticus]
MPGLSILFFLLASPLETRCGWLDNPSPANWWLTDRDGEWVLMLQGAHDRNGFIDAPWDTGAGDWVETNGSYGYGCGCFIGSVDPATGWATSVIRVQPLPLAQCRQDPALPPR